MTRSFLDIDLPDTPDSRLVTGINRLYSLARVGMAASDTSISVDLQKAGYTELFGTMGCIAEGMFDDMEKLEKAAGVEQFYTDPDQTIASRLAHWKALRVRIAKIEGDDDAGDGVAPIHDDQHAGNVCVPCWGRSTSRSECDLQLLWVCAVGAGCELHWGHDGQVWS